MNLSRHEEAQEPLLKACLDNELPLLQKLAVRWHLLRCASCRKEFQAMQQTGEQLRGVRLEPLDPHLRSRILASVQELRQETFARPRSRVPLYALGGAAAALLVAVLFVPTLKNNSAPAADREENVSSPAVASSSLPSASFGNAPASPKSGAASGGGAADAPLVTETSGAKKTPNSTRSQRKEWPRESKSESVAGHVAVKKSVPHRIDDPGAAVITAPPPVTNQALGMVNDAPRDSKDDVSGQASKHPVQEVQSQSAINGIYGYPQHEPVAVSRVGFDLKGYEIVTQGGKKIAVPFAKRLDALKFARATDGKLSLHFAPVDREKSALSKTAEPPVLYLTPADKIANATVAGSYWQPLPLGYTSTEPIAIRPAPDWKQFLEMRWYPGMTIVGGITDRAGDKDTSEWLPGSHIQIGTTVYSTYAAYRVYAAAHPDAWSLQAVSPASATPPINPASKTAKPATGRSIPQKHKP